MDDPPSLRNTCCVCGAPGGKQCTKCKSRHYCSKACQLVDWHEGGHKAQCKQLAAAFQDRLLDEIMPLKIKAAIFEDVSPAAGFKAAPAVPTTVVVKDGAYNVDSPIWRITCSICLEVTPLGTQAFYSCCCKKMCWSCSKKSLELDTRCPLCHAPGCTSTAEFLKRLQKHVDAGNAEAQYSLASEYDRDGGQPLGLKQNSKKAVQLYKLAAAQGHAEAMDALGGCYDHGQGVKIDYNKAALWYRRAAEQGYPGAQYNFGVLNSTGKGVPQSYEQAVRWLRLAAAQGHPSALFNLGIFYVNGQGVPMDNAEALRFFKRAVSKGHKGAVQAIKEMRNFYSNDASK